MPTRFLFFLFALGLVTLAPLHADSLVNVTNFGAVADSGQDATPAFKQAIAAAASAPKPVTLMVPPGRYDFFSTHATKRNCYYSNATETGGAMRTIAMDVADINDLTISAEGATLMMRGKMTMLVVERCERFTLRGATFDFARPTVSEITCVEKGAGYWIGSVHPDSTYQIQGATIHWIGEDWNITHNMVQPYDPVTHTTWRGGDPTSGASSIQDLGNRRLQFNVGSGSLGNAVVGRTYQFRNTLRDETGIWFSRCKDVALEDVTVRFMHGFGILAQFTENLNFAHLTVAPDPTNGRTCAAAADILHFSNCKGLISVHDSTLTAAQDDGVNIHGTHLQIVGTPAANQIKVSFKHPQSWGFQAYQPGDQIEFIRKNTLLSYATRTVTAVDFTPGSYDQTLTLDPANPTGITLNSDVVENITWTPSAEFVNCDVALVPTRGFLLTTRRGVRVEGCRFFRTPMAAILCEEDGSSWYESGPMRGLTLRRNSFFECAEPVVQISPNISTYGGAVHSNVMIQENDFTLKGNGAVHADATDGFTISGNRFRMRNQTTPAQSSLVSTSNSSNVQITANTVEVASTPAIAVTNGGFEQPDVAANATAAPTVWSVAGNASIVGEGASTTLPPSQFLTIAPASAVFQYLGPYDPVQGTHLNGSLKQLKRSDTLQGSGAFEIRFFAWDGTYAPEDGTPSDAGLRQLGSTVLVSPLGNRDSRLVRYAVDLTDVSAGTRVWIEVLATGTDPALLDELSAATASAAVSMNYATWIAECGLAGLSADPMADPDGDGVVNLMEFALDGRDPAYSEPFPVMELENSNPSPVFRIRPRAGALVDLRPQFQANALSPSGWQNVVDGAEGLSLTADSNGWLLGVAALNYPRMFFRLSAVPVADPLVVTGGDFGSVNSNGSLTPGWYESGTANWVEGTWMNSASYPITFPAGSGAALLMDNLGDGSYIYQKLGVLQQAHIDAGTLRITADFAEKPDGTTNSARFDVFLGSFPGAANGNDIFNSGLTNIGSFVLSPEAQGLTAASGNQGRATSVRVGDVSLAGLAPGGEVWLRITDAADGTDNSGSGGDLIIDNVKVEVISQ